MNNEIKALFVTVGEKPKETIIQNELSALQKAVNGNIEFYPVSSGINIICNEEGKINGMEGNRLIRNEIICGDFLIVGDDGMGETISLTPAQVKLCKEQFKTPLEFSREQIEDNLIVRVIDMDDPRSCIDTRPTPMPKRYGSKNKSKKNRNRER